MKQQEIDYSDIMKLGFTEVIEKDSSYFNKYGFDYAIIEKKLTKRIYISWSKENRTCDIIRIDKEYNIKSSLIIIDLDHLKAIINFFIDK